MFSSSLVSPHEEKWYTQKRGFLSCTDQQAGGIHLLVRVHLCTSEGIAFTAKPYVACSFFRVLRFHNCVASFFFYRDLGLLRVQSRLLFFVLHFFLYFCKRKAIGGCLAKLTLFSFGVVFLFFLFFCRRGSHCAFSPLPLFCSGSFDLSPTLHIHQSSTGGAFFFVFVFGGSTLSR